MQSRAEFLASLPRRRIAAGAVIRDADGRVCLVEPTYKPKWQLPGGTVEADESPADGCRREVIEELGVDLPIGPLLCMDWVAPDQGDDPHGALIMVYDGGVVDPTTIEKMITPPDELHGFRFVDLDQLQQYATERNCRRIRTALSAIGGPTVELDRL